MTEPCARPTLARADRGERAARPWQGWNPGRRRPHYLDRLYSSPIAGSGPAELYLATKMQPAVTVKAFWTASLVLVLFSAISACSMNRPIAGTGDRSAATSGTLAGLVSTDAGKTPVTGRKVTVTNTATNAHFDATTSSEGGYTIMVPAGHYAIDVELREGERLEKRPQPTDVGAGDLDSGRDFVITR